VMWGEDTLYLYIVMMDKMYHGKQLQGWIQCTPTML
jgi:hypothetical protein